MPSIADLKPGGTIYSIATGARGSLTCFAMQHAKPHQLYGVTARHVLPANSFCSIGDPNEFRSIKAGGPAVHAPAADFLYFEIAEPVRTQLTEDNFIPVGYAHEPRQVWDPGKLRDKVKDAKTAVDEDRLKAKTMPAKLVGSTQTMVAAKPADAVFQKLGSRVTETKIAPGDSGGCLLDHTKMRYLALVSHGDEQNATSTGGGVVLLHDEFAKAGLVLATWGDRYHWA
jgi:hypothetical protein